MNLPKLSRAHEINKPRLQILEAQHKKQQKK